MAFFLIIHLRFLPLPIDFDKRLFNIIDFLIGRVDSIQDALDGAVEKANFIVFYHRDAFLEGFKNLLEFVLGEFSQFCLLDGK